MCNSELDILPDQDEEIELCIVRLPCPAAVHQCFHLRCHTAEASVFGT